MIKIEKIIKKYNLNILEETYLKKEIDVSEFLRCHAIDLKQGSNFGLVVNFQDIEINKEDLNKISIIVICNVKSLSEKEKETLINYGKPIIYTEFKEREVVALLENYLLRKQKSPERIHATMLSVFGEGVIILGKSGIGKSELALALINRSHLFVGDDAIDVVDFAGQLMGRAPKTSRDFIEVRGVGIINIRDMYGIQCIVKEQKVSLAVELVILDDVSSTVNRLGEEYSNISIGGVKIPLIQIPVSLGREITPVVEAAVITFKQRKYNKYIAINDLNQRIKEG